MNRHEKSIIAMKINRLYFSLYFVLLLTIARDLKAYSHCEDIFNNPKNSTTHSQISDELLDGEDSRIALAISRAILKDGITMSSDEKKALLTQTLQRHKQFVSQKGRLAIIGPDHPEFKEHSPAFFKVPVNENQKPMITLKDYTFVTSGTYLHELDHFMRWLRIKKRIIQKGSTEQNAHVALRNHAQRSAAHLARVIQYLEDRATDIHNTYAQVEAIRMLDPIQLNDPFSSTHRQALSYVAEAYRKLKEKHHSEKSGIDYFTPEAMIALNQFKPRHTQTDEFFNKLTESVLVTSLSRFYLLWYESYKASLAIYEFNDIFKSYIIERIEDPIERQHFVSFIHSESVQNYIQRFVKKERIKSKSYFKNKFMSKLLKEGISIEVIEQAILLASQENSFGETSAHIIGEMKRITDEIRQNNSHLQEDDITITQKDIPETLIKYINRYMQTSFQKLPLDLSSLPIEQLTLLNTHERFLFAKDYRAWKKLSSPFFSTPYVEIVSVLSDLDNNFATSALMSQVQIIFFGIFEPGIFRSSKRELREIDLYLRNNGVL